MSLNYGNSTKSSGLESAESLSSNVIENVSTSPRHHNLSSDVCIYSIYCKSFVASGIQGHHADSGKQCRLQSRMPTGLLLNIAIGLPMRRESAVAMHQERSSMCKCARDAWCVAYWFALGRGDERIDRCSALEEV